MQMQQQVCKLHSGQKRLRVYNGAGSYQQGQQQQGCSLESHLNVKQAQ